MTRYSDLTLVQLLDALGSPAPTPGGGTAAAIAGAIGVSLLMMVSGLARTRDNTEADKAALGDAHVVLSGLRNRLTQLADRDAAAYDQVTSAYRLPKATDEEKGARLQSVQLALRGATGVPLETLRAASDAVTVARIVAEHGNRSAASDVRVALELLEAAAAGAAANVESNLAGLKDEGYRKATAADVLALTNTVTQDAAATRAHLV